MCINNIKLFINKDPRIGFYIEAEERSEGTKETIHGSSQGTKHQIKYGF